MEDYDRMAHSLASMVNDFLCPEFHKTGRMLEEVINHRDELSPMCREDLASALSCLAGRARSGELRVLLELAAEWESTNGKPMTYREIKEYVERHDVDLEENFGGLPRAVQRWIMYEMLPEIRWTGEYAWPCDLDQATRSWPAPVMA